MMIFDFIAFFIMIEYFTSILEDDEMAEFAMNPTDAEDFPGETATSTTLRYYLVAHFSVLFVSYIGMNLKTMFCGFPSMWTDMGWMAGVIGFMAIIMFSINFDHAVLEEHMTGEQYLDFN
jgi:hypothetical protein